MDHQFDVEEATKYGANAAIILNHLKFWIQKNIANGKNHIDGEWWTYNSIGAFHKLMPYLSEKQIRSALAKLELAGVIGTGNHNKVPYDQTKWYCIRDISILQKVQLRNNEKANEDSEKGEPIPDNKTDNKTYINKSYEKSELNASFEKFWEKWPKKVDKAKSRIAWNRLTKKNRESAISDDIAERYRDTERKYIPNPTTYLHGERWNDELPGGKKAHTTLSGDDKQFGRRAL